LLHHEMICATLCFAGVVGATDIDIQECVILICKGVLREDMDGVAGVTALTNLPGLMTLHVARSYEWTALGLIGMPALQSLSLDMCGGISDQGMRDFVRDCKTLTSLDVDGYALW